MITPYFLENFWVGGAFLFTVFTPVLLSCYVPSLSCSCQSGIKCYSFCRGSRLAHKLSSLWSRSVLVSNPAATANFLRQIFCYPGVWASVNQSNLKRRSVHPCFLSIGSVRIAWNVYGQFPECYWTPRLSVIAVGRTRHFLPWQSFSEIPDVSKLE